MKVAVCIIGLPRKVKEGYEAYYKHIIDNYETDVYIHYWDDNKYGEADKVLQVYKPKKYIAEKPFSFKEYTIGVEIPAGFDSATRPMQPYDVYGCYVCYPQQYSWQKSFSLVDGEYDCVILGRFDLSREGCLDLSKLDMNKINVSNAWDIRPFVDDCQIITGQKIANQLFGDVFDTFVALTREQGKIYHGEYNFMNVILKKGLYDKVLKNEYLNLKLLRENKVWYNDNMNDLQILK